MFWLGHAPPPVSTKCGQRDPTRDESEGDAPGTRGALGTPLTSQSPGCLAPSELITHRYVGWAALHSLLATTLSARLAADQTRPDPSAPAVAMRSPPALNATATLVGRGAPPSAPVAADHTRDDPSRPAVAMRSPSGLNTRRSPSRRRRYSCRDCCVDEPGEKVVIRCGRERVAMLARVAAGGPKRELGTISRARWPTTSTTPRTTLRLTREAASAPHQRRRGAAPWGPRTGFVQASSCLEDTNDEVALSVATVWEIAINGRPVKVTLLDCWATALARRGFGPMPVTAAHAAAVEHLPFRCRTSSALLHFGYPGAFGEPPLTAGGRRD